MTLHIQSTYMDHSGGTKFYEAVLVSGESRSMLIKRWGKVELRKGGGETMVMVDTPGACAREYASIVAAKKKRGYSQNTSMNGYGLHMGAKSGPQALHDTVYGWAASHYANEAITQQMRDTFGGEIPAPAAPFNPPIVNESHLNEGWGQF